MASSTFKTNPIDLIELLEAHMAERTKFASMDHYLAAAAPSVRGILQKIRQVVAAAVPDASQTISYQMPAFRLRRVFFYFAAFKGHIGVYPPAVGDPDLQVALEPYRGEKGNLKFPLDQDIPYELIGRVAKALAQERGR